MSLTRLADKVAIVTGASRGIGRAIAIHLARNGAKVVVAARDAKKLNEVVAEIKEFGGEAFAHKADLSQIEAPPELVHAAVGHFGGIDIVINNAGATKRGAFLKLLEEDWHAGFALKFFVAVRLVRAAWPHLRTRSGSIVNIAGVGGRTPGAEFTIGGSVNAAMLSFTKALAELGINDGIQVNAINPGFVRTDRLNKRIETIAGELGVTIAEAEQSMIRESQISRVGESDDIAYLVIFLVSAEGRFLHGSLIDMDGGQTKTI
jgi:NAD(P)-dependent dehydrogenase (short-subunit alcohol dehydrogenase family)